METAGARSSTRAVTEHGLGVFSKQEIEDRLARDVDDPNGLVITPLFNRSEALDADSVDLRLGTYFLLPRARPEPYYCPDERTSTTRGAHVQEPGGGSARSRRQRDPSPSEVQG